MRGILAAFTLLCVLAQQTFGTKQTEVATLNQDGSLLTDDVTCYYRGRNISNGETLNLEDPCEGWTCHAPEKKVTVMGCQIKRSYGNCLLRFKSGEYPNCCPGRSLC
ncbi:uncharacterized protein LOC120847458 [Ixodes scapularis]|uniref:uncharacterized protein LOC120847458 n=1 Tax=Ixodes scapularis TaxID=6945 RepID=UPI001A9FBFB5|nr:uncharacterized protein LOC120847458 [Ixodes scapularis]